jgi:small subunit ribosomal protein S27Ae
LAKHYVIKDGKLHRTNPFCPRCGRGVFMADKGEWWSCGKCGDRYYKKSFEGIENELVMRENSIG